MFLVIDVGNMNMVFVFYDGDKWVLSWCSLMDVRCIVDDYVVWFGMLMWLEGLEFG